MSNSPEKPRSTDVVPAPTAPRALMAQARPQPTIVVPTVSTPPPPAAGSSTAGGKAIVKHSSFSSSLPSDYELLRQFKQTIVSGAHTEFSAIIKPLAQKAVTVSREEADHQWELAAGEGLSGAEAVGIAGERREAEEAKQREADEVVRLAKEKEDEAKRAVAREEQEAQARARAETARLLLEAKEAEQQRIQEESRRIKEEFRQRQLAEEAAEKAYLARHAPLYQAPSSPHVVHEPVPVVPAPAAVAPTPALPPVQRASPAPWDPKAAGANDRISLAGMAKSTPPPPNAPTPVPSSKSRSTVDPARLPTPVALPHWTQPPPSASSWLPPVRHPSPLSSKRQSSPLPRPDPPAPTPVVKREAARDPMDDDGNKRIRLGDLVKSSPAPPVSTEKSSPAPSASTKVKIEPELEISTVPGLLPPSAPTPMDVDQPTTTSLAQCLSQDDARSTSPAPPLQQSTAATSIDFHDPEADEVDALIGMVPNAPPSPPAFFDFPQEQQRAASPTLELDDPILDPATSEPHTDPALPAEPTPPAVLKRPAADERISFASLKPSTKSSLLDRINLSTETPSTSVPAPPTPLDPPADQSPSPPSPLTAANLPSLLSRISNFYPFTKSGPQRNSLPPPSSLAGEPDTPTATQSKVPPTADARSASTASPTTTTTAQRSAVNASSSVPLAQRIEHPGLAMLAESKPVSQPRPLSMDASLPKKPQPVLASPTTSTTSSTHSKAIRGGRDDELMEKDNKHEHERQGLRQERRMSEAAKRRHEEAERARAQRENEAKRYLQAKTDRARQTSGGGGPSPAAAPSIAAVGGRPRDGDLDRPPPARRTAEAETDARYKAAYDQPARDPQRPGYRVDHQRLDSPPAVRRDLPVKPKTVPLLGRISSPPRERTRPLSPPPKKRFRRPSPPPRPVDHLRDRPSLLPPNAYYDPPSSSSRPPPLDAHRDYTRPRSPIMAPNLPPSLQGWARAPPPPHHPAYDPPYAARSEYDRMPKYDRAPSPPRADRLWNGGPPPADYYDPVDFHDLWDHRGPPPPPLPPRRDLDRSPERWYREPPPLRRWD